MVTKFSVVLVHLKRLASIFLLLLDIFQYSISSYFIFPDCFIAFYLLGTFSKSRVSICDVCSVLLIFNLFDLYMYLCMNSLYISHLVYRILLICAGISMFTYFRHILWMGGLCCFNFAYISILFIFFMMFISWWFFFVPYCVFCICTHSN